MVVAWTPNPGWARSIRVAPVIYFLISVYNFEPLNILIVR